MRTTCHNIAEKDREKIDYLLAKFNVLMKRKAGMYCRLDLRTMRIVASGEQKESKGIKLVKEKQTEKVIAWLKKINIRLKQEDPLGGKILSTNKNNARKVKNNPLSV